ncbi:MAG: type II secretion system F family protein [Nocardioidaceae bacterium]
MTTASAALATGAAAAAAWLLTPPGRIPGHRAPWRWAGLVAAVAGVTGAARLLDGTRATLVVIGGLSLVAAQRLWRQHQDRRAAMVSQDRVVEACRTLGAELAAGRPPGEALALAAADWVVLAPAAEAFTLGGSVPEALRRLAARPGAGDLAVLGAAWEVAQRSGQGLATAVRAIADELTADAATRRVVTAELASARATARVVAGLPLAALAMGSGVGGDPWRFLLGTPVGLGCLAGGLVLALAGLGWIEAIAGGVIRR